MTRLPRVLSTLAVTAGLTAGVSFGAPAHALTPTPPPDEPVRAVVSTTTTADINVPVVESDAKSERIVDRAVSGPTRLAGANRYETSVQISRRAYSPTTASTVYLVGGNKLDEALAGAALTDGPVLLVPTTGTVPASVLAEIRRLTPGRVIALGGGTSVSSATLATAAQGISTSRLGTDSVYETAAAIGRRAFPNGASTVYLARVGGSPDAVVGGSLSDGPVVPVPATGTAPAAIRGLVSALSPRRVTGLGGPAAISDATLSSAASGRSTGRIAGAHRYETSGKVARAAFPTGSSVAYLASGNTFADAVAGGTLGDGPVVLTPPASATALVTGVADTLKTLGARNIGTLGGPVAVPDGAISAVAAKVPTATTGSLPTYVAPSLTTPDPTPTPTATPSPTPTPTPAPTPTPTPTPTYTPPPLRRSPRAPRRVSRSSPPSGRSGWIRATRSPAQPGSTSPRPSV
ncbi:cell wall-binding repeat-containing protein [Mobilicoccus caccae]|uniref:Cell wall binding repeat protein n=1 Tax=Mobilicoccus caccae TaxID=1859295 RepID=A0ABQ6IPJ0_9MICO|nr:cell wall-binding repeat-containing protein [Mobilicoccus caccae]GMA38632.1 hypothetical protein GCM10025883_06770 [Mobilicoccus caccae]